VEKRQPITSQYDWNQVDSHDQFCVDHIPRNEITDERILAKLADIEQREHDLQKREAEILQREKKLERMF